MSVLCYVWKHIGPYFKITHINNDFSHPVHLHCSWGSGHHIFGLSYKKKKKKKKTLTCFPLQWYRRLREFWPSLSSCGSVWGQWLVPTATGCARLPGSFAVRTVREDVDKVHCISNNESILRNSETIFPPQPAGKNEFYKKLQHT